MPDIFEQLGLDGSPMTAAELEQGRRRLGLSQTELAAVVGFRRQGTISEYEVGKKPVNHQTCVIVRLLLERLPPE